jgi:hypothetical protein
VVAQSYSLAVGTGLLSGRLLIETATHSTCLEIRWEYGRSQDLCVGKAGVRPLYGRQIGPVPVLCAEVCTRAGGSNSGMGIPLGLNWLERQCVCRWNELKGRERTPPVTVTLPPQLRVLESCGFCYTHRRRYARQLSIASLFKLTHDRKSRIHFFPR